MNQVLIGTAFDNQIRFYFANTKELATQVLDQGPISPISLTALVDSMSITAIIALLEKTPTNILSVVNGDGLCGKIYVKANNKGEVKGFVSNRYVYDDTKDLTIVDGVGTIGNIEITKDYGLKTPYYSETSIIKGDILSDYSYYFAYSEQTPTAIGGGIQLNNNFEVEGSGILMIQVMPNCDEKIIEKLETIMVEYGPKISKLLKDNSLSEILDTIFKDDYRILEEKTITLTCDCSYEKCVSAINLLSNEDKKEILANEEIEMVCDWCQTKYIIDKKDIEI